MISYLKKNYSLIIIVVFGLLYLIFLSNNPTSDSYSNAFSSLSKEDMFRPHHLLYSAFGYLVYLPFKWINIEPIKLFQTINVLFAAGCLLVVRVMMRRIYLKEALIVASILFIGSCFGFQRFAIDNECYIIPLFFILLSMNFVQSFLIKNKFYKVVLCGLVSVIGCLFHQIAIFTLICSFFVFVFNGKWKNIITFFIISLIIPIVYSLIVFLQEETLSAQLLTNFVLHDYKTSFAEMPILKNVILLSAISFVRTFIQVHGYVFEIFSLYPVISISVISIAIGFLIIGVYFCFKLKKRELTLFNEKRFVRYCWVMLILYFGFAAFSNGNAEFMIIIPFLIILLLIYYFVYLRRAIFGLGLFMFIWNFLFALFPMGYMKLNSNQELYSLVIKEKEAVFVLKDKVAVDNIYAYKQLNQNISNTYKLSQVTNEQFSNWIKENKTIYTDYFGGKEALSRVHIAESNTNKIASDSPIINNQSKFQLRHKFIFFAGEKDIWEFVK
jgi:hypothetical protein